VEDRGQRLLVWNENRFVDIDSSDSLVYVMNYENGVWQEPILLHSEEEMAVFDLEVLSTEKRLEVAWNECESDGVFCDYYTTHISSVDGHNWSGMETIASYTGRDIVLSLNSLSAQDMKSGEIVYCFGLGSNFYSLSPEQVLESGRDYYNSETLE